MSFYPSNFHSLVLASTDDSCLSQLLLGWWPMFFSNFTSFSVFIITVKMSFPFSSICWFLSVFTYRFLYYWKGYHLLLWFFILMLKLSRFVQWKSLHAGSYIHLICPNHSLNSLLLSCTNKISQTHLVLSLTWCKHQPFLQELCSL